MTVDAGSWKTSADIVIGWCRLCCDGGTRLCRKAQYVLS